jgi:vancomycin resistance protein YoaR
MSTKNIEKEEQIKVPETTNIIEQTKDEKTKLITKTNTRKKYYIIPLIILIIIIIILIGLICIFLINTNNDKIISGLSINNIDISNLTIEEAKEKLLNYVNDNLPENIELEYPDYKTSIPVSLLSPKANITSTINTAYKNARTGNFINDCITYYKTLIFKNNTNIEIIIDEDALKTELEDISSKLPDTVINSSYYIDGTNLIITAGKEGNVVDIDQMLTYIKNGINNFTLNDRTLEIATKTKQPIEIDIEKIYEEIYKEPVDAYYTQDPFAVYPSENGLDFNISLEEAKTILENEQDEYTIPLKILYPNITTNMIGTEAFPDLLSSYSTKYATSNTNRTTNLILAAEKINGYVLMPGETFSYNQVVGERTIAAGYKEAAIYVSGEVVDGLGGGICQITSTLYNAVLYANLEIVERSNHQFVPSYVTASRDATVVYGSIDFKFKNNRDYPIKLVCSVSNGIASFQIYGLKTDNEYDVEISSYVTGSTSEYTYSEAYKILKQNGQVISKELLSKDTYKNS